MKHPLLRMLEPHRAENPIRFLLSWIATVWLFLGFAQTVLAACTTEDFVAKVSGNQECFVLRTWGVPTSAISPTLLVWLHGNVSSGGPADYLADDAAKASSSSVISIAFLLHGYSDSFGNTSTGSYHNRSTRMVTAANLDSLGDALARLKAHYGATRLILVGHSVGAMFAADIAALKPGLVTGNLLVGCPCDLGWIGVAPISLAASHPLSTKVIAITGARDTTTVPADVTGYIATLASRGIDATYIEIPDGQHNFGVVAHNAKFDGALAALLSYTPHERVQEECLLIWAERNYAALFPTPTVTRTRYPYTYRQYPATRSYLGISAKDGHVYYPKNLS